MLSAVPERQSATQAERVLATVLFTDVVGSSAQLVRLGDRAWGDLLRRHHAAVRLRLAEHGGEELDTAGDGFFAAFDAPSRAIECACAVRDDLAGLGLEIRAGVHAGECERVDGKLTGLAVLVGARISRAADVGEVLVSATVRDLVAGSGIDFADRGDRRLKGLPDAWRLFAVAGPVVSRLGARTTTARQLPGRRHGRWPS